MGDEYLRETEVKLHKLRCKIDEKKKDIGNRKILLKDLSSSDTNKKKKEEKLTKLNIKSETINNNIEKTIKYYEDEVQRAERKAREDIERIENKLREYKEYCFNKKQEQEKKLQIEIEKIDSQKEFFSDDDNIDEEGDKQLIKMNLELKDLEKELDERQTVYDIQKAKHKQREENARIELLQFEMLQRKIEEHRKQINEENNNLHF